MSGYQIFDGLLVLVYFSQCLVVSFYFVHVLGQVLQKEHTVIEPLTNTSESPQKQHLYSDRSNTKDTFLPKAAIVITPNISLRQIIGQFWYFVHWAPFLVLGWNRVVDTEMTFDSIDYWSCLGYLAHFKSPLPASEWLATGMAKPVIKTTLNVRFEKCAIHRVQW